MSKKVKSPKIIEGHSLSEYFKRFGKGFTKLKLDVTKDKNKLKPGKKYWKIDGTYYQVNHSRAIKVTAITLVSISVAANVALPLYFCVFANKERYVDYKFKYWNDNTSLNTLKDYVKGAVTPGNSNYVPKEDRIATFDMDGTLFGERAPIYIEWQMYHDYLSKHTDMEGIKVTRPLVPGEEKTLKEVDNLIVQFMNNHDMDIKTIDLENWEAVGGAALFNLLSIPQYVTYVDSFLEQEKGLSDYFTNMKYKDMFYKPMIEVVEFLQVNNFDVYIVSGTDRFMVRDIVNKHLSIPVNKVIGMDVNLTIDSKGIVRRGDKLMYKNVENVKVELITQEIAKKPVLSFGNSGGDVPMHDYCLSNENYKSAVFMVDNDDNEREYSQPRGETWKKDHPKYNVFSMKNNWKTIYGDNVKKVKK